jgi:DNA-binding response OmpR family regulator
LVVEDDALSRLAVTAALQDAGYQVLEASDGDEAMMIAAEEKPALIILDVVLPKRDGISVVRELRRRNNLTPVLLLTTYDQVDNRVEGLEAGADDYLSKPYDLRELLARVRALLRRSQPALGGCSQLRFADLWVDLENRRAERAGERVDFTGIEYAILSLLSQSMGKPVSREVMLGTIWGYTYLPATRTVDTHIWRLRKKLRDSADEPKWLRHHAGLGYTLTCECVKSESEAEK